MVVLRVNNVSTRGVPNLLEKASKATCMGQIADLQAWNVGCSFQTSLKENVPGATAQAIVGYHLLGRSEEPQLKELKWFLEKRKRSDVQNVPLHITLTLKSCGQLGPRWEGKSWELHLS